METSTPLNSRKAITVSEAADRLGLGIQTIYRKTYSGEIPSFKVGSRRLIPVEQLDRWIEERIRLEQSDAGC